MKVTHVVAVVALAIGAGVLLTRHHAANQPRVVDNFHVADSASWHRYDSPDGGLSVVLPSKPDVSKSSHGYHMTSVLSNFQSYVVTYTHYGVPIEDKSDQAFAAVRHHFRKNGYTVIATRDVQVAGHPGEEVHFETSDGVYGWTRMFLIDDGYYQLMYMTKQDRSAPTRFWESLIVN